MGLLAKQDEVSFALVALNGPDKGSLFKLLSSEVYIGRSSENDISCEHDNKVSRRHAVLRLGKNGVEIRNVSERNELLVNGEAVGHAILQPRDIIQLGGTKLQFKVSGLKNDSNAPALKDMSSAAAAGHSTAKSGFKPKQESKKNFYIISVVAVALLVWLLTSDTGSKKDPIEFRTSEDVSNQIEEKRMLVDEIRNERVKKGYDSAQFKQAQANYIKGFRDFQKGQYERAKDYFQTCLSLFPNHRLCQQYLAESNKKFGELVQYYLTLGREYFEKGQYGACKTAYTNVKVMIKDKASQAYQEADSGYAACLAKQRGVL